MDKKVNDFLLLFQREMKLQTKYLPSISTLFAQHKRGRMNAMDEAGQDWRLSLFPDLSKQHEES